MNIQEHINKVEELEKIYLAHKYIRMDENSLESIRTFQEWHSAASVLFCEFISEDDKFLKTFVEANISGNAYVLASIYDSIHTSYKILMSKVEKAQRQKLNDSSTESHGDSPLIFISSKICLAIVSQNYKSSEVCMNEVGALSKAQAAPLQIVLPNADFCEPGWLLNTDKASKIDDVDCLDSLEEKLCASIGVPVPTAKHWNPCTRDFLNSLKTLKNE